MSSNFLDLLRKFKDWNALDHPLTPHLSRSGRVERDLNLEFLGFLVADYTGLLSKLDAKRYDSEIGMLKQNQELTQELIKQQ